MPPRPHDTRLGKPRRESHFPAGRAICWQILWPFVFSLKLVGRLWHRLVQTTAALPEGDGGTEQKRKSPASSTRTPAMRPPQRGPWNIRPGHHLPDQSTVLLSALSWLSSHTGRFRRTCGKGLRHIVGRFAPTQHHRSVQEAMPLAMLVIPGVDTTRNLSAMRSVIQAMTSTGPARRRSVALEMAATLQSRAFMVRATSREALLHAELQLRARYPQAEMHLLPPDQDPFRLEGGERASICELRHAGPHFLSLETFDAAGRSGSPRSQMHSGSRSRVPQSDVTDPILGVLAALDRVPPAIRLIAQLALVPAPDTWSVGDVWEADQFSLSRMRADEVNRDRQRALGSGGGSAGLLPLPLLVLACLGLGVAALWLRASRGGPRPWAWLPASWWIWLVHLAHPSQARTSTATSTGSVHSASHSPPLHPQLLAPSLAHALPLLVGGATVAVLVLIGSLLLVRTLSNFPPVSWFHRRQPVYDPAAVAQKTREPAVYARLRLIAIGPAGSGKDERRANRQQREFLLDRLVAAYRQYHLAGGAVFAVRHFRFSGDRLLPTVAETSKAWADSIGNKSTPPSNEEGQLRRTGPRAWRRNRWIRGLARSPMVLGVSEAAALWHLPDSESLPTLSWVRDHEQSRRFLPPAVLVARDPRDDVRGVGRDQRQAASAEAYQPAGKGVAARTLLLTDADHPDDGGPLFGADGGSARVEPAPSSSARLSIFTSRSGVVLGHSRAQGLSVPVVAPPDLFTHHSLAVAKTGKGKSTLLQAIAYLALTRESTLERGIHGQQSYPTADPVAQIDHAPQSGDSVGSHTPLSREIPRALVALRDQVRELRQPSRGGLVVLDPHGDLLAVLLGIIPPQRQADVVVLDLADVAYPVGLNPLDVTLGRDRDKAVENLLLIFSHIWTRYWGPRMENAIEYALKTLYELNADIVASNPELGPDLQYTLLDVAPLLQNEEFRNRQLHIVEKRDPELARWWFRYYQDLDPRMRQDIINPVLTKMAKFASSRVARRIIGQGRTTLDLAQAVQRGQILLVNTARGIVGADTAALIGATVLGLLRVSLEEQVRRPATERRRIHILVDEFQTVPGADYGALLAELRKFGASFTLATQTLASLDALDRELRKTVLANIDNLLVFQTSADDARFLESELDDVVDAHDLINLDPFTCYAKLSLDGRRLPVFSLTLAPPLVGDADLRQRLVATSRSRVAPHSAAEVDAQIEALADRHSPREKMHRLSRSLAAKASRRQESRPSEQVDVEKADQGIGDEEHDDGERSTGNPQGMGPHEYIQAFAPDPVEGGGEPTSLHVGIQAPAQESLEPGQRRERGERGGRRMRHRSRPTEGILRDEPE